MFRDGPRWLWGYALFAQLALIGGLMAVALLRADRPGGASLFSLGVVLLGVIVATPSDGEFHFLCSLLLLLLLYVYYAVLLHLAETPWRYVHWVMPVALALLTAFQSYGLWQKAFIVYFVLTIAIHRHLLSQPIPKRSAARRWGPAPPLRKRVVYVLEEGKEWGRR
jgi:hypothetical protein